MNKIITYVGVGLIALTVASCNRKGCTNFLATNYDEKAKKDDGTCILPLANQSIDEVASKVSGSYIVKDSRDFNGDGNVDSDTTYTMQLIGHTGSKEIDIKLPPGHHLTGSSGSTLALARLVMGDNTSNVMLIIEFQDPVIKGSQGTITFNSSEKVIDIDFKL
jgi:hypothetical protein